jgi:hypothetical protein
MRQVVGSMLTISILLLFFFLKRALRCGGLGHLAWRILKNPARSGTKEKEERHEFSWFAFYGYLWWVF